MNAEQALAEHETDASEDGIYMLEPIARENIPARHPVAVFAERYEKMTEGHFIPDEGKLLKDDVVRAVSCWLDHVEPVELGGHVDFYILDPEDPLAQIADDDYSRGTWMSESMDDGFVAARYHECVGAAILRKPKFSRGAVPSHTRSFMMQFRGVFPMFADNHARLRLAIMSAETFIELKS